jgi:hypothetical protein
MRILTGAQRNILSVIIAETTKQVGKNKGCLKSTVASDSFDGRSFRRLLEDGFVVLYSGVLGHGYVATEKALSLNIK